MIEIKEKLLDGYNRPGRILRGLKGIVLHWTANTNKGANALAHYRYFNRAKKDPVVYGSAHYVVDDSNIYRYVPENEFAYHVGAKKYKELVYETLGVPRGESPNYYTIGVEMCVNSDGDFVKTKQHTIDLLRHLFEKHGLTIDDLYRHYDITGKDCPRMYVSEPAWQEFKNELMQSAATNKYKVNAPSLNVRSGPGTTHNIIRALVHGMQVDHLEQQGKWVRISEGEWVHGDYLLPQ